MVRERGAPDKPAPAASPGPVIRSAILRAHRLAMMSDPRSLQTPPAIREATTPEDVEVVRGLFLDYAAWLAIDLSFQGFEQELASLPMPYTRPPGVLLLAECGEEVAGCVGLRPLGERTGEVKRLYVPPRYRGRGVGLALMERVIAEARQIGYARLLLDTLPMMASARRLYAQLGFQPTSAYYHNPIAGTSYMALTIGSEHAET